VEGTAHCHHNAILHRDIKLDNILLDQELTVKICDFGVSRFIRKEEMIKEQCGTPAYIAPEIIKNKGYTGFAADVWSTGVLLYVMITGTFPFTADNLTSLNKTICKGKFILPSFISKDS
jgi:MAP/microtubule affinity-regulating kinase